ncbi:MAG: hypothetical protein R2873_18420 [Caldilineaceae bacterium]
MSLVDGRNCVATDDGVDVVHGPDHFELRSALIPWDVADREGGRAYYMRLP